MIPRVTAFLAIAATSSADTPGHNPTHSNQQILFNHVGKAGGGSVRSVMRESKLLDSNSCCKGNRLIEVWHPYGFLMPAVNYPFIVMNVRDPVDRFSSAFDWRSQLFCRPYAMESRKRTKKKPSPGQRESRCWTAPPGKTNADAITDKQMLKDYNFSKNALAEDLRSTDGALRKKAAESIQLIQHAKVSLWERSGGIETINALVEKGVKIYAVAIADGFNFDSQIEAAFYDIAQVMKNTQDEAHLRKHLLNVAIENVEIALKDKVTSAREKIASEQPANTSGPLKCEDNHGMAVGASARTSVAYGCHSSGSKSHLPAELRIPIGQYYDGDYDIIDRLQHVGCHGALADTCRGALASILARRPAVEAEDLPTVERLPDSTEHFFTGGRWLDQYFSGLKGPARCAKLIRSEPSCNQQWFSHGTNTDGNCWCAPNDLGDGLDSSTWSSVRDVETTFSTSSAFNHYRKLNPHFDKYRHGKAHMTAGLYRIVT